MRGHQRQPDCLVVTRVATETGPSRGQAGGTTMVAVNPNCQDVPEPISLLVRRVNSGARPVAALAADVELERLTAMGGLFVLADLADDPSAEPLGVAVFDPQRDDRRARLVFFSAEGPHGQRLLEGALMLLRSDGIELVEAEAGEEHSLLLERLGFSDGPGAKLLYWM